MGLLAPEMEKLGLLGPTDKSCRRPGDVSLNWAFNRALAIDVPVICPSPRRICDEPCCTQGSGSTSSDAGFVGSDYDFVTMVFFCDAGLSIRRGSKIIRFASRLSL